MRLIVDAETRHAARRESRELIPVRLLQAMAALVIFTLGLVSFAVLTERPKLGQPKVAALMSERALVLAGDGAQITVRSPEGRMLLETESGGFLTVVRSGLAFERRRHGVTDNPPVLLRQYANDRLQLADPATGWAIELTMFGDEGAARWRALITQPKGG
ncbi:MAG: photosynthetic complex assembly protein PuhC [Silicimonas sp.]|nr:photosynthetic complex assembly protein PuhC [Silicimonas sp.]